MIPHLEQQIAFLTACREHGEDRVEWHFRDLRSGFVSPGWKTANNTYPCWVAENEYEFRIRPRTHVIPKAEIPAEDPDGLFTIRVSVSKIGTVFEQAGPFKRYRTEQDRDAVVTAMLAREEE